MQNTITKKRTATKSNKKNLLKDIANTIRGLSMDGVAAAHSGHPGLPLGMADVAAILWTKFLKHHPSNPNWIDRDRFILSAGHGSMLIYSLLHLYGYEVSLNDLKNFRQWGSKTPGHPENYETQGVETTTGPLGQGIANGVGMALAEKSLAARFNKRDAKVINHFTYVIASDGDLQEGISHEACAFAGHNQLGKLIVLYDNNSITIDGDTDLSYSDDVKKRFEAYHWQVQKIHGHNYTAIETAIEAARKNTHQPSIIICDTKIGFGSPNREGTAKAHGEPFPEEEIQLTKTALGLPPKKKFYVPKTVAALKTKTKKTGAAATKVWNTLFKKYQKKYPELATTFSQCMDGFIPKKAFQIPLFSSEKSIATRSASGQVLNYLAPLIPSLMGGSADLTPSNKTFPKGEHSFTTDDFTGRYIHYGIREHGMGAIMNGMALHGGILPYSGTFFVFSDYMRPAMRMAALMKQQVIYVLTHDSIGLGEDGPTHQPIAHLASLRAMPNMSVIRPMDANETAEAWKSALKNKTKPTCLVLTRQNLPVFDRKNLGYAPANQAQKGGYVLTEDKGFKNIIIASGSEVEIALDAKKILNKKGFKVRVVSMPSTDIFDQQTTAYKNKVLPPKIKNRVAVEAAATLSWYKYVGLDGKIIGIDRYGASAPYQTLYQKLGITPKAVANAVNVLK
ncbi:MAG TPA: transketolase [Phaeodactylibacter sp.]|nr:transketolase [Phaeodactylibacter sp.]